MSDILELRHPVTHKQLDLAVAEDCMLQCSRDLFTEDLRLINDFFAKHPDVLLRVYKGYHSKWNFNLNFLSQVPAVRHLHIDANSGDLNDFQHLAHLPKDLQSLCIDTLAAFSDKKLDRIKQNTQALEQFTSITTLTLCGKLGQLEFLSAMQKLEKLELWRNGLKNLNGIELAQNITQLKLFSAGIKDLSAVSALSRLESLEVWNQRNLTDWSALGKLKKLKKLYFVSCGSKLPMVSLETFKALRVLVIDKLNNKSDMALISKAPNLKCLILHIDKELLDVKTFSVLANHPSLVELRLDNGSKEFWDQLSETYGWKVVYSNYPAEEHL